MRRAALAALLLFWPLAGRAADYVLAVTWQPAFCETRPDKPECQGAQRIQGFSLHGLWPQPKNRAYCGVAPEIAARSREGEWNALPAPPLRPETRAELDSVMPGAQSRLDRHEWAKHGSCYGGDAERYFADSLALLRQLNGSSAAALFRGHLGRTLDGTAIRAAFDRDFGPGAGERVRIACQRDGARNLIVELTLGLSGRIGPGAKLGGLMTAAEPTAPGCPGGIVDPDGFQ